MDIASLIFRTFAHATEDEGRVEQALRFASGAEDISKIKNEGYHGNPIIILEGRITRSREIRTFLNSLEHDDVRMLLDTLESRVDEESMFFLRLDKQAAYEGRIALADNDDVISVRGKIKSYPQKRESALKAMETLLCEVLEPRGHKG